MTSCPDSVLVQDRVFANLLQSENIYYPPASKPYPLPLSDQRKQLAEWMLEICQILHNSNQIFLSSVRFLDIILHQQIISSKHFHTLASACLCLASKILDPRPLSLQDFVRTRTSEIPLSQLQEMEMLVLTRLRWELCSPTSLDFVPFLISKLAPLALQQTGKCIQIKAVQDQIEMFLVLAATEACYSHLRPSILVSGLCLKA